MPNSVEQLLKNERFLHIYWSLNPVSQRGTDWLTDSDFENIAFK